MIIFPDLKNKIAIVTGAYGNLGPVWINGLLNQGAIVIGIHLPENLNDKQIQHKNLLLISSDIRRRDDLSEVLNKVEKDYGPPNILVANAGIDHSPISNSSVCLTDIDNDSLSNLLETNIIGTLNCIQIFGKSMLKAQSGSIVIIGSLYGHISPDARFYNHIDIDPPFLKHPGYGASKAAIINLVKYYSTHWAKYRIRINSLSPGGVLGEQDKNFLYKFSERVPLGRLANPDELMDPMLFLASEASSYITGIDLLVDGGFTAW